MVLSAVRVVTMVLLLLLGRWTLLPEPQLALLWPAAGFAVWWLADAWRRGSWRQDAVLLVLAVALVNALTGTTWPVAGLFAGINLTHGAVGAWLLHRLGGLRAPGRAPGLSVRPVGLLLVSVVAGGVSGSLSALAASTLMSGSFVQSLLWLTVRNSTGTFLVLALAVAVHDAGRTKELVSRTRAAEWLGVLSSSAVLHLLVFGSSNGLPLTWVVLPVTVWAGLRLGVARTVTLTVLSGILAALLTLQDRGVFALVEDLALRATIVQGFLLVTVLVGLVLSQSQEDRARLTDALTEARSVMADSVEAALIGNGIVVTEGPRTGRLLQPNPALRRLLGTTVMHPAHATPGSVVPERPEPTDPDVRASSQPPCGPLEPGEVCWLSYLGADDRSLARRVLSDFAAGRRREWTGEMAHHPASGGTVWAQVHLSILAPPPSRDDVRAAGRPSGAGAREGVVVAQFLDVTARKEAEQQLTHLALHDGLTGLPNRLLLRDRIDMALSSARRTRKRVGLVFLDLDRFKAVNDSLGHEAGDLVLGMVADRLRSSLRPSDTAARIGGDEFVVVMPGVGREQEAQEIAERLVHSVGQPVLLDGRRVAVGVSGGLTLSRPGDDATSLLDRSDAAMYAAKQAGRGRVVSFTDELAARAPRRASLRAEAHQALAEGQIVVHYQPVVDMTTGVVTACEALPRWQHPTRGLLVPEEWLDVMEDGDLVVQLHRHVLAQACQDAAVLAARARLLRVHVDVTGRQLAQPGFIAEVVSALDGSGLPPRMLQLEIAETGLAEVHDGVSSGISRLSEMGVRWAVDDFGAGHIPLRQLVLLPIATLSTLR